MLNVIIAVFGDFARELDFTDLQICRKRVS